MKVVNKIFIILIKRFKKDVFLLDKDVPEGYLIRFILINIFKYIRGSLKFFKPQYRILVGRNTVLRAKENFKFLGKNIHIDRDCYIDALSRNGIQFGNNISLQKRVMIECTGSIKHLGKGLILGNNVGIGSNSFLGCSGGIEIGDDTIFGNFVSLHSENHNFTDPDTPIRLQGVNHKGIIIGKNCWIGAKATILDGTILGDGCVVAAGAVLNGKTYEKNSIIGGVPAKIIKSRLSE
ncbi:MAG: acetyltransferase-like isoleucine patch superfamily enzyme [Polaribacter sp.]|jgi:acetyltransferase-like isoleucine patch superfamily enzyme